MRKKRIFGGFIILSLLVLILLVHFELILVNGEAGDKRILGYCQTMKEEAINFSGKKDYELLEFKSASDVLIALNANYIHGALVGRKAKAFEINNDFNESIIDSGYTLVSNQKSFIEYNDLSLIEVHTYLSSEITKELMPHVKEVIYYGSKEEAFNEARNGNVILIDWDDWMDEFELVVVMDRGEKVKEFRGVFLYL